jgi:hypothetical protein
MMRAVVITLGYFTGESACTICRGPLGNGGGPRLCLAEDLSPVCQSCGKQQAPELAALLDLARAADRVGQIGNHTVMPPLNSLL